MGQPESQQTALAVSTSKLVESATADLTHLVDVRSAFGSAKGSSTLGAEGMHFEAVSESLGDGVRVVSVRGEVDMATGPALARALLAPPDDGVASVVVDLTGCTFIDSTGLHLMTRTQRRCDRSGGRFAVVSANRALLKVFRITELDQVFAIYPSRAAALDGDGHQ